MCRWEFKPYESYAKYFPHEVEKNSIRSPSGAESDEEPPVHLLKKPAPPGLNLLYFNHVIEFPPIGSFRVQRVIQFSLPRCITFEARF